jgi:sec-independent protein translocase protein TatB
MLGLGWTEVLVIGVVALIVIGPKDLPNVLRQVGRFVTTVRRMGNDFKREFNKATALEEIRDIRQSITKPLQDVSAEINKQYNTNNKSGATVPSGAIKPRDPAVESVHDQLAEAAGVATASGGTAINGAAVAAAAGSAAVVATANGAAATEPAAAALAAEPAPKAPFRQPMISIPSPTYRPRPRPEQGVVEEAPWPPSNRVFAATYTSQTAPSSTPPADDAGASPTEGVKLAKTPRKSAAKAAKENPSETAPQARAPRKAASSADSVAKSKPATPRKAAAKPVDEAGSSEPPVAAAPKPRARKG